MGKHHLGRTLAAAAIVGAVVGTTLPPLAAPARAHAAESGTWHGVSYDIDDAGTVTFHAGAFTGDFTDDPFSEHAGLADALEVGADGTVVLPAESYCMFQNCSNLIAIDLTDFDSTHAIDMDSFFDGCASLTSIYFGGFETGLVESMDSMFSDCSSLVTLDVSGCDTSRVSSMDEMFSDCTELTTLDISSFDTLHAESMTDMFEGCENLTYIALGDEFSFDGATATRLCSLPEGTWAPDTSGRSYAGDAIPNRVEATYTLLSRKTPDMEVRELVDKRRTVSIAVAAGDGEDVTKTLVFTIKATKVDKKRKTAYVSLKETSAAGTMMRARAVRRAPYKRVKKTLPKKVTVDRQVRSKWTYIFVEVAPGAFKNRVGVERITLGSQIRKVGRRAFAKCSATKLALRTKKLTSKARVKKCLTSSRMKTVLVSVGNKKKNRQFCKRYRKVFEKGVVGKKVRIG